MNALDEAQTGAQGTTRVSRGPYLSDEPTCFLGHDS